MLVGTYTYFLLFLGQNTLRKSINLIRQFSSIPQAVTNDPVPSGWLYLGNYSMHKNNLIQVLT